MAKKVEIIVESVQIKNIMDILKKLHIAGYSLINDVIGSGKHGFYDAEELSDVFKNSYFMVVCQEEQAEVLTEKIGSFTKKYGGICFVSDVEIK